MADQNPHKNNGFWFGLIMGSLAGSAALYFLGTDEGRNRLRKIIDVMENLSAEELEEIKQKITEDSDSGPAHIVSDIHSVLDKIESTLPTKKEVKKYFSKDGKIIK